jgi:hypothetical protein
MGLIGMRRGLMLVYGWNMVFFSSCGKRAECAPSPYAKNQHFWW